MAPSLALQQRLALLHARIIADDERDQINIYLISLYLWDLKSRPDEAHSVRAVPGRITGEREVRTTFRGARMVHQVCGYTMAYLRVVQTVHHSLWTASRKPSENGSENTAFWTLWWARRPLWTILLWIRWLTMYPPT